MMRRGFIINIPKVREMLKLLYNTPTWRLSVDKMSNRRATTLYFNAFNQAKLRNKNGSGTQTDALLILTFDEVVSSKNSEKQKKHKVDAVTVEQLSFLND